MQVMVREQLGPGMENKAIMESLILKVCVAKLAKNMSNMQVHVGDAEYANKEICKIRCKLKVSPIRLDFPALY
jgi:hypothetical protein